MPLPREFLPPQAAAYLSFCLSFFLCFFFLLSFLPFFHYGLVFTVLQPHTNAIIMQTFFIQHILSLFMLPHISVLYSFLLLSTII